MDSALNFAVSRYAVSVSPGTTSILCLLSVFGLILRRRSDISVHCATGMSVRRGYLNRYLHSDKYSHGMSFHIFDFCTCAAVQEVGYSFYQSLNDELVHSRGWPSLFNVDITASKPNLRSQGSMGYRNGTQALLCHCFPS